MINPVELRKDCRTDSRVDVRMSTTSGAKAATFADTLVTACFPVISLINAISTLRFWLNSFKRDEMADVL